MRPATSLWSPWTRQAVGASIVTWTVIALLSAGTTSAARMRAGVDPLLWQAFIEASGACLAFAVLTPFGLAAGQRWPVTSVRAVLRHVVAAVAYWLAAALLTLVMLHLAGAGAPSVDRVLASTAFACLLAYVVTIGVAHLIEAALRLRERERQLAVAQRQALTGQLRPHFLFNALNAIATLIGRDPVAAERLLLDLSTLLRLSLERGHTDSVSLMDEVELTNAYLAVMRARIGDRLRVRWSIPRDLLGAQVPHLLMLPLVENALKHGIAHQSAAGQLGVSVAREGESLRLTVTDDGPGPRRGWQEGFGLSATRTRLAGQFGGDFELTLCAVGTGGAATTVRFPFRHPS